MGYVRTRNGKRGKSYQAHWTDHQGREQVKTFTEQKPAKDHVNLMEAAKIKGESVVVSKITVAEAAREWAAARPHRASTATRTAYLIEKHIADTRLGDRRLSDVRNSEVQAWVTDRSRVLAPSTLRLVVSTLRSVFSAAVLDRIIPFSPAAKLSLPRSQSERIVPLTVDQVRDLSDVMPPRCRAMVIAQAGLGLRLGELLALRVSDVDFLRRTVRIDRQLLPDGKTFGPPKTPRSVRTVPLPQLVAEALSEHIRQFGSEELIFTTPRGLGWEHVRYTQRYLRKASEGITSHDLRHHFVSVLLARGLSVVAVADLIGDTPQMVLKVYGHMMPGSEDTARRAIDSAWNSDPPSTRSDSAGQGTI